MCVLTCHHSLDILLFKHISFSLNNLPTHHIILPNLTTTIITNYIFAITFPLAFFDLFQIYSKSFAKPSSVDIVLLLQHFLRILDAGDAEETLFDSDGPRRSENVVFDVFGFQNFPVIGTDDDDFAHERIHCPSV